MEKGIPLFRSQNIHFRGLRMDDIAYIPETVHETMPNSKVKPQDVLLNITGASIGRCFYVPENFGEANVNQHVCIIRPTYQLYYKFLYYCLSSHLGQQQIFSSFTGASREGLNFREIGCFKIPFPSFELQKRIAKYLDKTCAAIDAAIELKRKQLDTLEALRKSIIHKAVTRGLDDGVELTDSGFLWMGRIPVSWKVEKLKYVTESIIDGTHFTPTYVDDGIPFLRVTDIHTEKINLNSVKYISHEEHKELIKRARPKFGDILLSKNGTIGLVKVVDWEWEFSIFVSLCLIRLQKKISPYFFSYYFDSDVVDQQLFESSKRTSVTNLHLVKIREMVMPVPSIAEQKKIVDYLDRKSTEIKKLKTNLFVQITTLEDYRKSLIHECVTGKRRITEADIT